MHQKSFLHVGLVCSILTAGSIFSANAAPSAEPLILSPISAPSAMTSNFTPPFYNPGMPPMMPPMTYPGNHTDAIALPMVESISETPVADYFAWEFISDGVYSVSSSPEYTTALLGFSFSYLGGFWKNSEETSTFSTPTLELIGLEGVDAGDLQIFTSIANGGYQFMLSATVTLSTNMAFSFTGFRITAALEPGEHTVEFNSQVSGGPSMYFSGSTLSQTDPGSGLTYQAVPEPSSFALLAAAGAAGWAWRNRSRRRK